MATKSSSLGRGLSSLIPQKEDKNNDAATEAQNKNDLDSFDLKKSISSAELPEELHSDDALLRYVAVKNIEPNPHQPRVQFNEETLAELVDSIREHGILQPVIVSELGADKYQIIMGERRWRAAQKAGLDEIPVVIRDASDVEKLELALVENIVREDLNPVELASAYKKYIDEFGFTHDEAAKRLGKSRSGISNTMRLLQLPEEIKEAIRNGHITDAHAKIIVGLPTESQQMACFRQVVDRKLSVARTRVAVQKMGGTKEARRTIDARDEEMEKKLRQYLGTRVAIQRTGYRGRIVVEFFNYDEMLDLIKKMLGQDQAV